MLWLLNGVRRVDPILWKQHTDRRLFGVIFTSQHWIKKYVSMDDVHKWCLRCIFWVWDWSQCIWLDRYNVYNFALEIKQTIINYKLIFVYCTVYTTCTWWKNSDFSLEYPPPLKKEKLLQIILEFSLQLVEGYEWWLEKVSLKKILSGNQSLRFNPKIRMELVGRILRLCTTWDK